MSKKIDILKSLSQSGELPRGLLKQVEFVREAAKSQGLAVFTADCSKARNLSAILRSFAKGVNYPVFFGKDTDALLDCLKETLAEQKQGYVLLIQEIHSGDPALKDDVVLVLEVLQKLSDYANKQGKVVAYLVDHTGEHQPPELGRPPSSYTDVE